MMPKAVVIAALALALAGCTSAQERALRNRPLAPNPSAIVAAELAFNRLAQEKGVQHAFREYAHKDAVMFVPLRVKAQEWLRSNTPGTQLSWAPHAVFTSCDGSAGATTGAWQGAGGRHGYFTTIWLRGRDGSFKWVLDHGSPLSGAKLEAPEFIEAKSAKCGTRPPVGIEAGAEGDDLAIGLSADQTLSWRSLVRPDGSRVVSVRQWDGTAMVTVIDNKVGAPAAPGG
jgi:hypothetical protein